MTDERAALHREDSSLEAQVRFEDTELFRILCGVSDAGVDRLEKLLSVELIPRGHSFLIKSSSAEKNNQALEFFESVKKTFHEKRNDFSDHFDAPYLYREIVNKKPNMEFAGDLETLLKKKIYTTSRGRTIYPRTRNQAYYVESILHNSITFCLGPAGTGKTFLSIACACRMLAEGDVERIILTRPAVEAGESLGFLPGDLSQKVDPYLRPVYDALYDCMGMEKIHELIGARKIEIAPLAYMRGRTINDSIIILDEAQNSTLSQLKMFLTRLGKNSRMCIGGDVTQIDLSPGKSGLKKCISILKQIEGLGVIEFMKEDIVRNPLVEKIVGAFEEHGDDKN